MSKYMCLCGRDFKRKKEATKHIVLFKDLNDPNNHIIFKKNWKGRIIDWLIDGRPYWKFTGALVIYFTIIGHFGIKPTILESLSIGIGLGLYID